MAKKKPYQKHKKSKLPRIESQVCSDPNLHLLDVRVVSEFVIDRWKIHKRATDELASERILAACERAEERMRRAGFVVKDLTGEPYDTGIQAKVLEHDEGDGSLKVAQCLSPAIYFQSRLIREAEIITKGKSNG